MSFYFEYVNNFLLLKSTQFEGSGIVAGFTTKICRGSGETDLRIHHEEPALGLQARRRFHDAVLPKGVQLALLHQTHSCVVWRVENGHGSRVLSCDGKPDQPLSHRVDGDALVSDLPGLALGVQTADCFPVLLWDRSRRVAGAVHAGWRGTLGGICREAVATMRHCYGSDPADIQAVIGPGIGGCCYEVSPELAEMFRSKFPESVLPPGKAGTNPRLDLAGCLEQTLRATGIRMVDACQLCGRCRPLLFHSYRRDGADTGRMIAFIFSN